jgi:hypothetical protein
MFRMLNRTISYYPKCGIGLIRSVLLPPKLLEMLIRTILYHPKCGKKAFRVVKLQDGKPRRAGGKWTVSTGWRGR